MRLASWITILALAGCSSTYREPEPTADHPASPDAPVVSTVERTSTLDLSASDPVGSAAPGGHAGHGAKPSPAPQDQGHGEGLHEAAAPSEPVASAGYVCPMHPEVTSDRPGQRCPKCGMTLTPRKQGEHP